MKISIRLLDDGVSIDYEGPQKYFKAEALSSAVGVLQSMYKGLKERSSDFAVKGFSEEAKEH